MIVFLRRVALIVAAALSLSVPMLPALAQEISPAQLELARKYVDLTDNANMYETVLVETGVQTMRTVLAQKPDISNVLEAAITKTLDGYKDRKGELMDQFARLYAVRFTTDELKQMVDFYSSPVGIKLVQTTPQLNTDLQTVISVWRANVQAEFYSKVKAELKTQGIVL
jgi:hypothetical protein